MKIYKLLKEAISGEPREYTSGSINKAIFMLSVPMVLEMLMESLFSVVDVFFVGKLGVDAVATVGLTESMLAIVYSLGFGLATAASTVVARRVGEKNVSEAIHSAVQAIYITGGISLLISFAGFFSRRICCC